MKVHNVNRNESGIQKTHTIDMQDSMADKPLVFQRTLNALSKEQYETHLKELVNQIDEQGDRLEKKASIKEFEKYRQLIRNFLDEVVSNGYAFSKENAFSARGRQRFFATVKVIDSKLDELGKEVLKEQSDSLAILDKIDDIRGLIVDMML